MNQKPTARPDFSWENSVWFFDVDDTLVDFSGTTGLATKSMEAVLARHYSQAEAQKVAARFEEFFRIQKATHQSQTGVTADGHEKLEARIVKAQEKVFTQHGLVKYWSREVLLKLAVDDVGLRVTPELLHEAVDAYWVTLSQESKLIPGTLDLLQVLDKKNVPFYLLTSSDGRLKMFADGTFSYLPEYSEGMKRERIDLLRQKGIAYRGVSVGDPEDKPHPDFFQKGINMAEADLGRLITSAQMVMVGDSFAADLKTPKEKLGFGLVILVDQNAKESNWVDENQIVTNNLRSVPGMLP